MSRSLIFIFVLLMIGFASGEEFGVEPPAEPLLRDGFALPAAGVDGRLTRNDANDAWFFEIASSLSDTKAVLESGTELEVLASSVLEKITADAQKRLAARYRLWGTVTKYKGRNFIFPSYFLPLVKTRAAEASVSETSQQAEDQKQPNDRGESPERTGRPSINDANYPLSLPPEILRKLESKRTRRQRRIPAEEAEGGGAEHKPVVRTGGRRNSVLIGRTAFLLAAESPAIGTGHEFRFVFNALGRKVQRRSFWLLPCQGLELAEIRQAQDIQQVRFRIAGVVTRYKGRDYLLLQRAIPAYNYQNLNR